MKVRWIGTGESAFPTHVYNDTTVTIGRVFETAGESNLADGRECYILCYGEYPTGSSFLMAKEHFEVVE